ncbi:MAG TPA: FAD:protein FMN transferase, partial [Acidimicrobiales bacterium]|nr:FAD:protein FMN transferase [Acidimicrobiales bacterium]
ALDAAASRFREDSELTGLNASAGHPVQVSWALYVAIEEALQAAQITDGIVDPTVGHALELCGYDRDFSEVPPEGPPLKIRYQRVPGWRRIRLDRAQRTVTLPPGVRIDLGATAKAGCADRAARAAAALTRTGVLVNMGGDLAVAGPPPDDGWVVRVADRHDAPAEEPGVTVALRHGGLASSGTAARRWSRGGRTLHHLIDPTTGAPVDTCWRTVSVAATSCLEANIASTAAVILDTRAPQWLDTCGLAARLVTTAGISVNVGGWPSHCGPGGADALAS